MAARSRPPLLDSRPGTFSMRTQRGRSSATMRWNSHHNPLRSPASPARRPATLRSWQGNPPQMRSTGARFARPTFRTSSCSSTFGQCRRSTARHCLSFSTCHTTRMPARSRPMSIPPTPENSEPTRRSGGVVLTALLQVLEQCELLAEVQLHLAGRAVALLADDQLGATAQVLALVALPEVVLRAVEEQHGVRVLLQRTGVPQVAEPGPVVRPPLGGAAEL